MKCYSLENLVWIFRIRYTWCITVYILLNQYKNILYHMVYVYILGMYVPNYYKHNISILAIYDDNDFFWFILL